MRPPSLTPPTQAASFRLATPHYGRIAATIRKRRWLSGPALSPIKVLPPASIFGVGREVFVSFEKLHLDDALLRAITACGYTAPTDIQRTAIPAVLAGSDLLASAQTGTGKTAAFVLPALQRLIQPSQTRGRGPRVLVLTPTRELATQVTDSVRSFGRFMRVRSATVVGGVPYPPQLRMLERPLDLLVATPGRLIDHMDNRRADLSRVELLVLDEADRMLDLGFVDAVRTIAAATPANRQTLLFSATLEGRVLAIANDLLRNPVEVRLSTVVDRHTAIEQCVHQADDLAHKERLLDHWIAREELTQALIFTATKRDADRLAQALSARGHASAALHGDLPQRDRDRIVERMRAQRLRLLVATDVAARGLDIRSLSHVINYDLPMVAEDYIHRIGRTGRAGATGTAISFVGPGDWSRLAGIERLTGARLTREVIPGLEPRHQEPRRNGGRSAPSSRRNSGGGGGWRPNGRRPQGTGRATRARA
ncbi:ATP-dependent RNA helicase RhlE [Gammaproteobacteria bacterium]